MSDSQLTQFKMTPSGHGAVARANTFTPAPVLTGIHDRGFDVRNVQIVQDHQCCSLVTGVAALRMLEHARYSDSMRMPTRWLHYH